MSAAAPTPEVFRRLLETAATEKHHCKPARVREAYDRDAQTVRVEIGVQEVLPSGDDDTPDEPTPYPILVDVPVLVLRAGGYFLHFPIAVGDTGVVLFTDEDMGTWRAGSGGPADPGVPDRNTLSGAFFVPGMHVRSAALASGSVGSDEAGVRLGREGGPILEVRGNVIEVGGNAALAEAEDVKAHLQAISADLTAIKADLVTIATAAGSAPPTLVPTYVYGTKIGTNPIATTVTKGT